MSYLFHVRWKLDTQTVEGWAGATKSGGYIATKMRRGLSAAVRSTSTTRALRSLHAHRGCPPPCAQLKFLCSWICIESSLEVIADLFNYIASVNAELGGPGPFYVAVGLNVLMITLEFIEVRRTRRHGGKQTPWDRFWFGQVCDDGPASNPLTRAHTLHKRIG